MSAHLEKEMQKLKKEILAIGSYVEQALQRAVRSVEESDAKLADEVILADQKIDNLEVELEEDCLKLLALHQPVAIDLRYVVAILKINNELERIGDLAVTICKQTKIIVENGKVDTALGVGLLMEKVEIMLKKSLDALVELNIDLANDVCRSDDEVDQMYHSIYQELKKRLQGDVEHMESYLSLIRVIRSLERIADHTTNIAEDVVYTINGEIIRHSRYA